MDRQGTGPGVTDAVWRQLDPHAGRLSRRATVRLVAAFAAFLLVLAAGVAGWRAGLAVPRLSAATGDGWSVDADPGRRAVTYRFALHNDGWLPVRLTGAGRDGPGLVLAGVPGRLPATVPGHGSVEIVLRYQVTDCARVPAGAWPLPVRVARFWGGQTVGVPLPRQYPLGSRAGTGQVEWQRAVTAPVCAG